MRLSLLTIVTASVALAACSATGPGAPGPSDPVPSGDHPSYETFDPAGYDASPPAPAAEVEHDVPARVMAGRVNVPDRPAPPSPAPEPTPQLVEGYRVQIFNTANRDAAERLRGEASDWWRTLSDADRGAQPTDVIVSYQQPYYRVRLGAYATREEADRALAVVRQRYEDAFLVADRVTVLR